MGDKDLTSKELKKIAQFLDKKVKPVVIKHGKKIGGAALTAVTKTATTFSPTKKVKVAYKAGKAVVTGVKKIKNIYTNPKPVKMVTIKPKDLKQGWTPVGGKVGKAFGVYQATKGAHKGKTIVIPTYKVPASNVKKILKDLYKWK
tara:strand:+ start:160 stop:594 length:435 start_codon:yes stop_codon:yes gene_type:complete